MILVFRSAARKLAVFLGGDIVGAQQGSGISTVVGGLTQSNTLRLAMMLESTETAEQISNHFRNGGLAVRSHVLHTLSEFDALKLSNVDLIVLERNNLTDTLGVLRYLRGQFLTHNTTVPVVVLLHTYSAADVRACLKEGADSAAPINDMDFIDTVIRQSWMNGQARTATARLVEQVMETNKRCDSLIDMSGEPIAYTHQGMHIRANSAYLKLFGFDQFEDLEALSLLDLVKTEDVDAFKTFLKKHSQPHAAGNQDASKEFSVFITPFNRLPTSDPQISETRVTMELTPALYDGEDCLQVVVRPVMAPQANEGPSPSTPTLPHIDIGDKEDLLPRVRFLRKIKQNIGPNRSGGLLVCSFDTYSDLFHSVSLTTLDHLLGAFGERLREQVPPHAVLGRLGEAMFGIWVDDIAQSELSALAQKIYTAFEGWVVSTAENSMAVPAKIAGAYWSAPSEDHVDGVVLSTIKTLLSSKLRVQISNASQTVVSPRGENNAQQEILAALDHNRVEVVYSAVHALHGQSFAFYLVQAALFDKGHTVLEIPDNLPTALLQQIQDTSVSNILRSLGQQHLTANSKILLPVRLLGDANRWADDLCQHIRNARLPSQLFVIDFREKDLITQLTTAQEIIRKFKAFGMEIGLGGFGSSEQSEFLLQHLNPQWVRFDSVFLEQLGDGEQQKRLKDLTAAAQENGKKVIASGVDSAASMTVLFSSKVEYAQGHFLAGPTTQISA